MPTDLPTSAIGLIAFMVTSFGVLLWRISVQNEKANEETIKTFMTYIEKKNGNLERATKLFVENVEEQATHHRDAMVDQNDRHKQMMDDFAARLESLIKK